MITAVDTNVLLDVLRPNPDFLDASLEALVTSGGEGKLVICDIVYAEVCVHFPDRKACVWQLRKGRHPRSQKPRFIRHCLGLLGSITIALIALHPPLATAQVPGECPRPCKPSEVCMNGECVPRCTPGMCTEHEVCKLGQCYPNCRELGCPEGQRRASDAICDPDNQRTPSARCKVKTDCLGNLPDCCYGYCTSLESSDVDCGVCGNNCLAQGKTCEDGACVVLCPPPRSRVGDKCICPPSTLACQNACCDADQQCCDQGRCCPTERQCCGDDSCCDPATEQCFPDGDPLNGIRCCRKDRLCSGGCCQPDKECADDGTCQPTCYPICTIHQTCCHMLGVNYCRSPAQLCNEKCCPPDETCAVVKNDPDHEACCPSWRVICGGVCCDEREDCGPNGQCTVIPDAPDLCPPSCACCTVETVECGNKQLLGYTLPDGQPGWRCVAVGKLCPNEACGGGQTCCGPGDDGRFHCCADDRFCCNGQCCPLADSCCRDPEYGLPHGTCFSPARLLSSPSNCGKCGNKCPPHKVCRGGECK